MSNLGLFYAKDVFVLFVLCWVWLLFVWVLFIISGDTSVGNLIFGVVVWVRLLSSGEFRILLRTCTSKCACEGGWVRFCL